MTTEMKRAMCIKYAEVWETIRLEAERAAECRKHGNEDGAARHLDMKRYFEGAAAGLMMAAQALGMYYEYNEATGVCELHEISK